MTNGYILVENFLPEYLALCRGSLHTKFGGCSATGNNRNIFKFGVERRGVGKMCIFKGITGHISEMMRDRAKVAVDTNTQSHMPFQMRLKSSTLDDLEGQYCNRNCIFCNASSLAKAGLSCSA